MYYEHCSYFTATSLAASFEASGIAPTRIDLVYDGQYLVLDGRPAPPVPPRPDAGIEVTDTACAFGRAGEVRIRKAGAALHALRADGPLVIWQAGGKALALLTLTDTEDLVSGLVDGNPAKRGHFLPGRATRFAGPTISHASSPPT